MQREISFTDQSAPTSGAKWPRRGTQAIDRALGLLHHIAIDGGQGQRLRDLARQTGLGPATTRRLICALMQHGFVEQDEWTRRYYLGMQFFSVAAAASSRSAFVPLAQDSLGRLAGTAPGVSAILMRWTGSELVVLDRVDRQPGPAPGHTTAGAQLAIGPDAFSIAVLGAMPDLDAEDLVIANAARLPAPLEETVRQIRAARLAARRSMIAMVTDRQTGLPELAMPLREANARVVGVIGLSGPGIDTMPHARGRLGQEAQTIEEALRRAPDALDRYDIKMQVAALNGHLTPFT